MGSSETAGFWGFWGELGVWDAFRGYFAGSGHVYRCSGAAAGGPESGRAGGSVIVDEHVDDDAAVVLGGTGVCGTSRRELGGVGDLLGLRLEFWGEQGCSVE